MCAHKVVHVWQKVCMLIAKMKYFLYLHFVAICVCAIRESGGEVTIDTVCALTLYSVVFAVYAGNGLYLFCYYVYL